jgi:enamine deaminase RidA (YjgF/YER057c/UK114 family)
MNQFEETLAGLGLTLPEVKPPVANFVPFVITGNLLYVSGQIPTENGQIVYIGKLGEKISVAEGQQAARLCALNVIAVLKLACDGDLNKLVRCIRVGGFVNSAPEFTDQPEVINGASDLLVSVFGERGKHARTAVGVAALPRGVAVEVDAIFEIAQTPKLKK